MKSRLRNTFITRSIRNRLSIFVFFPCAAFLSTATHALTAEEAYATFYENWYHVEIIIFERIEQRGEDPETWPVNLSLSYPARLTFLKDDEPATEGNEVENVDVAERNNNDGDGNTGESNEADSALLATLQRSGTEDPLNKKYRNAIEKAERDRLTPNETPYILLDESSRALNHEARILGRDRSMRVLFHEAWHQPMASLDQAPAVVISGGEVFDTHYELEGSVKLFVSRYLHVHTNIWLSQFEANVGQDTQHWPPLPDRPLPPVLVDEDAEETTQGELSETEAPTSTLNFDLSVDTNSSLNALDYETDNGDVFGNTNSTLWTDYAKINERPFVTKQIVTLEQQRRMRSGELHYLDHPKLGIIIVIEKYAPEPPPLDQAVETEENN